jgi:surfactin synthase thioesterase subunit
VVTQIRDTRDRGLWVRRYREAPDSRFDLVCFAHAGGSATFFRPLSGALAPGVGVLAVQYPGRQDRYTEPPVDSIAELADRVAGVLADGRQDSGRPVAFFGHSMGAVVAFEVALRLRRSGHEGPALLFASGRRAPSVHQAETVHLRDDAGVLAELRSLSGTEAVVLDDEEMVRLVLPAVRADYRAIETYRVGPDAVLSCPIVGMVGDADPKAPVEEVREWRRHTTGEFTLRAFPGGHFYLTPGQDRVAATIREFLDQIPGS